MSSPIKQLKLKTFALKLPQMSKSKTGNNAVCDTVIWLSSHNIEC